MLRERDPRTLQATGASELELPGEEQIKNILQVEREVLLGRGSVWCWKYAGSLKALRW